MERKHQYFESLCDPGRLMAAWKQVRANRGVPGVDQVTIAEYEHRLADNLADLASRLRDGRYYPMPVRSVEMRKSGGGIRKIGILTVEDRIAQRAALDVLEPLFEPAFLDCSYGFRPRRSAAQAAEKVLEYRSHGDLFVVDADIADFFGSLDHEILMQLVGARVRDRRMLTLIRMWIDTGAACREGAVASSGRGIVAQIADYATDAVDSTIGSLLEERGYGHRRWNEYAAAGDYPLPEDQDAETRRQARREAYRRLGRDGALLALTYAGRARWLASGPVLGLAGAAVLAAAAYPAASRYLRRRLEPSGANVGTIQGGAISPLLSNIYLHEFDLAMSKAGLHLVRYADDWVILCRGPEQARLALEAAERKLAELRLRLNPAKTGIHHVDETWEFLGYHFGDMAVMSGEPQTERERPVGGGMSKSRELRGRVAGGIAEVASRAQAGLAKITGRWGRGADQGKKVKDER